MLMQLVALLAAQSPSGIEVEMPVVRALPRHPLAAHISDRDYPAAARQNGEQGIVRLSLDVGVDGRVTRCAITRSSGSRSLDVTTCRIVRSRARFTPARDGAGNPVPDRVESAIEWQHGGS